MRMTTIARGAGQCIAMVACSVGMLGAAGCNGQPTLFANPDPNLRKTVPEWKADAANRFPYKAEAPHAAEPKARAQVGYDLHRIEVVNISEEDWTEVEVWVNRQYVCYIPKMESRKLKEVHFPMLFNELGKSFPMQKNYVRTVELYREGKMYQIACSSADF